MYDEVRRHLQQLIASGAIRNSYSPWASNVVLARKKDGSLRMCIDFRQLNLRTIKDSYALPRIEEILDSLSGSKYFTVLDMKSGYHQVDLEEEHKARTAFTVGPLGFYEYNRMPFGLVNAPATYQRLMEECLGDLHLKICLIYLDDLIIFSSTYEEHMERLELVLQRLRECGLKLSPKKCSFLQSKVKFVGHIVSDKGVEADPEKIDKVVNWPTPTSPEEVRQFLGFAGYYRRYVKNFSQIAKPLNEVMPKPKKAKKGQKQGQTTSLPWKWGPEQDAAFQQLKQILSSPPILGYADYTKEFELHTDASGKGLGAVLYQEQDGHKRVISYASRSLSKTERHYPAHKLEFLALKWSVCDKFHDYLFGQKFSILTDNNPLTYVLTSAKLDATGHRWLAALAAYNFEIFYRPGSSNADADGLSRLPTLEDRQQTSEAISVDSVRAVCCAVTQVQSDVSQDRVISADSVKAVSHAVQAQAYAECFAIGADSVDAISDVQDTDSDLSGFRDQDWRTAQAKDPCLCRWLGFVRDKTKPKRNQLPMSQEHSSLYRSFDSLQLIRGVLYRVSTVDGQQRRQLVLPAEYTDTALHGLHNDVGHPGRDRTLSLLRDRFYWPNMSKDAEKWIQGCARCLRRKSSTNSRAPLVNIRTTQPLELVCMDFLTLETSKGGYQHILVITDHFTRYAQAIPTRNMTAKTTADVFFDNFVVHYGFPRRIHSDQGGNFESKLIKELCSTTGMMKTRTTPYHPMGNGQCERFNRTLLSMLGTLEPDQKADWKRYVGPLVHAYNSTRHETTGHSPFSLMFGREPRLPIDLAFGIDNNPHQPLSKYVTTLRERLQKSYQLASSAAEIAQQRQKKGYDTRVRGTTLQVGDRVLVRTLAFDGKHKLADKWEMDVYTIIKQSNPDIPVFVVEKENGEGRRRTLHRNLLLSIGSLPRPSPTPRSTTKGTVPKTVVSARPTPTPKARNTAPNIIIRSDDESDRDDKEVHWCAVAPTDTAPWINTDIPHNVGDMATTEEDASSQVSGDAVDLDTGEIGGDDLGEDTQSVTDDESESHHSDVTEEAGPAEPDTSVEDGAEGGSDHDAPVQSPPQTKKPPDRPRRPPNWLRSGDYALSRTVQQPEWVQKADYIKELLHSGLCEASEMRNRATESILSILTK